MAPRLLPGDWALATAPRGLRPGDVVVAEHPERPGFELVKRLHLPPGEAPGEAGAATRAWLVLGDNAARSTDSRAFGPLAAERIKGRVRAVYWPPRRARLVRRGRRKMAP